MTDTAPAARYADLGLTPAQHEVIAVAARLADGPFAERAAAIDREARNPHENYADLRASGLHAMCVPARFGGGGHDYRTYTLASSEIARGCGATALSFNMHASTTLWIGDMLDALGLDGAQRGDVERLRGVHYGRIVGDGALYAQTFSEGNVAASGKAPFGTTARKVDGGWVLDGKKIFASLSGAATHYGVLATEADVAPSRENTLYIAVPDGSDGFSIVGDWDPLGMRGTVSRTLLMKEVFVPDDAQLMPRGTYHLAARRVPHMFMTLSASYMGLAQGAFDFTIAYLRGDLPATAGRPSREHPVKQQTVADMAIRLEQMRALWLRAVAEFGPDPSDAARRRAYAAQFTVMEGAVDLCRLAIRTCGGRSMLKNLPLERMYRDARCGSLMFPWSAEICLERLGREWLYRPGERDG